MDEIIEKLKGLVENPDDISQVPNIIAKLEESKRNNGEQELFYQERITKLQEANRSLLAQVPITHEEENQQEEQPKATLEDAQAYLLEALGGDK